MEDVLDLYEKPYDVKEPVVCLDEKPVQLLGDVRPESSLAEGQIVKQDYEYERCGTANVFCGVEPLAGKHLTKVTPNRKGPEYAEMIRDIAASYPKAKTIHLVMDNLNTHGEKPLKEHFGVRRGASLWNRFTVHHTPKHASWLNQAEIEINLFGRQCLGKRRLPTIEALSRQAEAWCQRANDENVSINWTFTKKKAQEKFHYKKTRGKTIWS